MAESMAKSQAQAMFKNPYKKTYDLQNVFHGNTLYGFVGNELHYSPWDPHHSENPTRCQAIDKAIKTLGNEVKTITQQEMLDIPDIELLKLVHSAEHIELVHSLCERGDQAEAQSYANIYYNGKNSYEAAISAVRTTVSMAKLIAEGKYYNGFANVRPAGHHAVDTKPSGNCFFNNVAIAAQYLLNQKLAENVLIFDLDVHHGQGTQRVFYESNKVLYFSIHRYEQGNFWPNLEEGNFNYVGDKEGQGYNVNVPLNETGITDTDYLSIITNILLPMAYEFQPSFILISAGYDACLGSPEGKMNVTPAFYSHLIHLLSGLANGKILAVLEGGSFLPSLADGALQTVRAMLNYRAPPLEHDRRIKKSVIDTINNVKTAQYPYWNCFKHVDTITQINDIVNYNRNSSHVAVVNYSGAVASAPFPTGDSCPKNTPVTNNMFNSILAFLKKGYSTCKILVGIAQNNISKCHDEPDLSYESHERLADIINKFTQFHLYDHTKLFSFSDPYLIEKVRQDQSMLKDVSEMILSTHTTEFVKLLMTKGPKQRSDLYWKSHSFMVCQYSCANLFNLIYQIRSGAITHGIGLVRPPGHHAKSDTAGGFCLINNIVVAAKYAIEKLNMKLILIVDVDVHHGDGTQELTYLRNDIMYISLHKYDSAHFFPKDVRGNFTYVGKGGAAGYNINVPFNKGKLGNADYLHTWLKIVVPIAYTFKPDLILISAGFDSGINDPLGDYLVHPEVFGQMVQTVKSVAPTVVVLEGGYHKKTTSLGMVNCCRSLLGHPIAMPTLDIVTSAAAKAMQNSINAIKPYWPIMDVNKRLHSKIVHQKEVDEAGLRRRSERFKFH